MQNLTFSFKHGGILPAKILSIGKKLLPEITRLQKAKEYNSVYASINLPLDKTQLALVKSKAQQFKNVDAIIVIGIGGSNLGTIAVQEAILGKLHNDLAIKRYMPRIYFADTVDSKELEAITAIAKEITNKNGRILINAVSKSGGTTETIANLEVILNLLMQSCKRQRHCFDIVLTTDIGSKLWKFAEERGIDRLAIPKFVGGRYSVLSPVGLFPLAVLGLDIEALLKGAANMRTRCLQPTISKNPAARSAILHYIHSKQGRSIANTFLFSTDFESIGKWYRQLMGESIGKEWNKVHTKRVFAGLTPIVAVGSTDLHSMAQLYLGGPDDKFTSFISVLGEKTLRLPFWKEFNSLVPHIQHKSLGEIMDAIYGGVTTAFHRNKRPYCEIFLPNRKEFSIGGLLQFKMIEMMYLGFLLGVNPFDQPNVEEYKIITKKLLEKV